MFMNKTNANQFQHVLWIGGVPDAGKTTLANYLSIELNCGVYHYDDYDASHKSHLAETNPIYRNYLNQSEEDYWVKPKPIELLLRAQRIFTDRFPLVLEDINNISNNSLLLVEGVGLTPALVVPYLSSSNQAIWLIPKNNLKMISMKKRDKPPYNNNSGYSQAIVDNLFERDQLMADQFRSEVKRYGLCITETDEKTTISETAKNLMKHFSQYIKKIKKEK